MPEGNRRYRKQKLNMGQGCEHQMIAVHEFGHTLGMAHEQTRPDRDNNLKIIWDNIQGGAKSQYQTNQQAYTAKPYCYASVMHYGRYAATVRRGEPAMTPINCSTSWDAQFGGQRGCPEETGQWGISDGLVACDIEQLNAMYKCSGGGTTGPTGPTTGGNCNGRDNYSNCGQFKNYCNSAPGMKGWCAKTCC